MPALPSRLRQPVPGETWGSFAKVVLGVWASVWLYAALHNQYLIRIEPEHFTVWHYRIPFTQDLTLLGIAYAFGASVSPGVVLGMALFLAGRLFNRPKLGTLQIVTSTLWVWIGVEICSLLAGLYSWRTGKPLYAGDLYPDQSVVVTQTIQITAYLSGLFFSLLLIGWTWRRRRHLVGRTRTTPSE